MSTLLFLINIETLRAVLHGHGIYATAWVSIVLYDLNLAGGGKLEALHCSPPASAVPDKEEANSQPAIQLSGYSGCPMASALGNFLHYTAARPHPPFLVELARYNVLLQKKCCLVLQLTEANCSARGLLI